ncbi:MAG: protein jag [Lachnospiraceae bacterium]|nr:protein jag [Lachnospiraceae bacterium]MBP5255171.1 protein jag [Lachnospiraceae bacterium]
MAEKKIYKGVTVEDAITAATMDLGIPSDRLAYVVTDKGAKGFLGLGARPAAIEAWEKTAEDDLIEKKAAEEAAKAAAAEKAQKEKEAKEAKEAREAAAAEQAAKAEAAKKASEFRKPKENTVKPEKKKETAPAAPVQETKIKTTENDLQHFEDGKNFLLDVFRDMGMKVEIEYVYNEEDNALEMNLTGDEMGVLIGKRGQTLDSLQYLTSLVVNRSGEHYIRVKLDTENYRKRRKETLEALAKNIAYKVKRTRKSVSLEPMNPYERRIIHSALQQDNFVMTKSEGEEPYRHVVVYYKRNKNGKERQ